MFDLNSSHDTSNGYCRGALDVVVVSQILLPILGEERECVVGVEVLELQKASVSEQVGGRHEEFLDNVSLSVVARIDHRAGSGLLQVAVLFQPRVQGVLADLQLVRVLGRITAARVDDERNDAVRADPTADRVEVELAHGNAHAPGAEVAQAEDPAPIGEDDAIADRPPLDMLQLRPRVFVQDLPGTPAVGHREIATAPAEGQHPVLLAHLPHRWRVHDRQHQGRLPQDRLVIDVQALGVQRLHPQVRPEVVVQLDHRSHPRERVVRALDIRHAAEHLHQWSQLGPPVPGGGATSFRHLPGP
mmetsp:Transcript_14724/g.38933  ORF Transcript_14724/g.38933 Transcript_14724/m.38933 type:complete len:302 (-) Transcript_14724:219-1124(-)